MTLRGRSALAGVALLLALVLWPVSRGCLFLVRGEPAEAAARYHLEGGVLVETRRLEAVRCRYVYPSGPKRGRRCGSVTRDASALCVWHRGQR